MLTAAAAATSPSYAPSSVAFHCKASDFPSSGRRTHECQPAEADSQHPWFCSLTLQYGIVVHQVRMDNDPPPPSCEYTHGISAVPDLGVPPDSSSTRPPVSNLADCTPSTRLPVRTAGVPAWPPPLWSAKSPLSCSSPCQTYLASVARDDSVCLQDLALATAPARRVGSRWPLTPCMISTGPATSKSTARNRLLVQRRNSKARR